ncbi:hypothetical protein [Methylobacterium sp. AMS5]|uniref:hypothetical protein n=1 Tax=Methylobacterium sp. AMS5 TaxID=925818 RepID=UPI00074F9CCE|nr:hypothetical protein [Methylobacterium sp. AMS5]AMB46855.1 hypothetical protein Y590_18105 [Methylobacterium sp. AMS5]
MSEYQYYAFQAVDRPLSKGDRAALRAISTRAEITATTFENHYEWGDLKGDPKAFMDRWFDVHLYLANWGTRRLMLRLPRRLIDRATLAHFVGAYDGATLHASGDTLILDITHDPEEPDDEWLDDGSGRLGELAPLRADLLAGDLRMLYLVWLMAAEAGALTDDTPEPLPGLRPLTGALAAFAQFFGIDADLVAAAAERKPAASDAAPTAARAAVEALPEAEKTALLLRVLDGDGLVGTELRRLARVPADEDGPRRTLGTLRARAAAIRAARAKAEAERREAERQRQAKEAEKARRARVAAVMERGERAWQEVEDEAERRNASGYDRAAQLLGDLKSIAEDAGTSDAFRKRIAGIRERHARKPRFIERLDALR